jgi:hypothetical protein
MVYYVFCLIDRMTETSTEAVRSPATSIDQQMCLGPPTKKMNQVKQTTLSFPASHARLPQPVEAVPPIAPLASGRGCDT